MLELYTVKGKAVQQIRKRHTSSLTTKMYIAKYYM